MKLAISLIIASLFVTACVTTDGTPVKSHPKHERIDKSDR